MIFSRLFRFLWSTIVAGCIFFGARALEAAEPPAAIENATLPDPGFAGSIAIDSFRIQASRDLDPNSAANPAAYGLRTAGPNSSWDDSDDMACAVVPALVDARTVQLILPVNPLQPGKWRFETTAVLVDDLGRTIPPFAREFVIVDPPAGRIENTENDSLPGATVLPSIETPAGNGFLTGMGQGSFALASDIDYWRFDAEAGGQITLFLEADSPVNPRLSLRNSSGQEIASGEGPSGAFNQVQVFPIPASGFYYVMVHAEAAPAQYRLRLDRSKQWPLERENNDAQSAPNTLSWSILPGALHGRIAGALPANDPYGDCYHLGILNAGNTIRVNALFPSPSTADTNSLTMSIESAADASPLVSQTGGQLNHVAAADGVFFLRVSTPAPNLNLRAQYLIEIEVVDGMPPRVISVSLPESQTVSASVVDRFSIVWNEAIASAINALNQPPWTYGGHAYKVTPAGMTWPSAESYAVSLGGHLITLNDPAENEWARRTFGPYGSVWIGLNDSAQEGTFAWTSGDPLSFAHWNTGEPTNSDEEDSVIMTPSGFWSDAAGTESLVGVIEVPGADQDQDGWPNPVDPFPADPMNAVQLISIGPDHTPETADDARYRLVLDPYSGGTQLDFRITDGPLQPGDYRFSISQSVQDPAGNAIATNFVRFFSITNIPNFVLENRDNDVPEGATPLDAFLQAEDPAASGLRTGMGRGNLSSTADVDYWSFAGQEGDRLSVALSNQGGGYSGYGWYWQIIVRDLQGTQLAGFTSEGSGQTAPVVLPAAGTYTVAVSHTFDQIGEYQLRITLARPPLQLETEDNAHPGIANDLLWTSTAGHQQARAAGFLWASDTDFYRLGNLADLTAITLSLTQPSTSDLQALLILYRSNEPVATNTPPDNRLHYTIPASAGGPYSVAVTGVNGMGGLWAQYLLELDFADQAPLAVADVSLPLEGSTALLDRLTITFTKDLQAEGAADPNSYDLRSAGPDGQFDTADDNLYPILAAGYSGGVTVHSMIQGAPLQPGSYRFQVKASLKDQWGTPMAGDFERRFSVVNLAGYVMENRANDTADTASSLAEPMGAEDPAGSGLRTGMGRGNLSSAADVDYWSFTAETGDRLSVVLSNQGGGYSGYGWYWQIIVRDLQGTQLAGFTSEGSGQTAPVVLPAAGTYTVAVSHTFDQIGEYQLRITLARPPLQLETEDNGNLGSASPVELAISGDRRIASVAGALQTRVDLDYHRLSALTNGSTVFLSMRASQSSHGSPIVGVYDAANGYQIEAGSGRPFDGVAEVRITQDGDYFALVRTAAEMDSAWEPYVLDVQVVPTGTVDFPNLQVAAISPPAGTNFQSGQTVSFSFTVRNAGSHPTPAGPWMDRVVVSTNEVYGDADDRTLGQFERSGILEPGQGYTVDAQASLPEGLSGACFLIAHADYGNRIPEFVMEGDNDLISTNAFVVQLANYPDLVIEDIRPTPIAGGASLNVSWTLANRGNRETSSGLRQRIQIRNLNTGIQVTNVELAVETSLLPASTLPGIIECPLESAGRYRVMVIADSADQIYEFVPVGHAVAEQNNTAETDFDATLDLAATDLRAEPVSGLQSGASITIHWQDRNSGILPLRGNWQDRLVILNATTSETLLEARIPCDTSAAGMIPPGVAIARQHSFQLPDGQRGVGVLHVSVETDADNQVFEYDPARDAEQNNTATITRISVLGPYPDLQITAIQAPPAIALGQPMAVSWTITNQGARIAAAPWTETIYLAADATGTQREELISIIGSNSLAAAAGLVRTQSVLLPAGTDKARFLAVEIDSRGEVFELNETNNLKVAEQGTRLLAADLTVESVTAPSTAQFGQVLPVAWVVKNAGSAAASAAWRDQLWFSPSGGLDSARFLQDAPATEVSPLAPGARYTNTALVAIPLEANPASGSYSLWLKTDAYGQQPEMNKTNNAASSPAIALQLPPLPDLAVSDVIAPAYAWPGQAIDLSWTTINQGAIPPGRPWTETVLISADPAITPAQSLLSITITNPLAAGQFLVQTQRIALPPAATAGEYYLAIRTDAAETLIEAVEANNLGAATNTTRIASILTLQIPARQIAENASDPILRATVSHNGNPANPVLVTITNSDPSELTMPGQVEIPAGQNSASFDMQVVADGVVDGPQTVLVRVATDAFAGDSTSIAVIDTDIHRLSLRFEQPSVREGGVVVATVSRDTALPQPLEVKISAYYPGQLTLPQTSTIPANETSATFVLEAAEDDLLEADTAYDVIATAFGHAQASAPIVIEDNDWPGVRVEIAPLSVAEDAGAQMGIASVTRNAASNRQLVFELESSNPDALWVPNRLAIPAGATRLGFPILPVDDDVVTGARPVTVRAFVMDSTVSVRLFEAIPDTIEIAENDSPALRFTLERSLVAEGLSPATTGTLALNTATNQAVLVTLLSSDTTEAAVPSTVLLPANQESVIFEVHTLQDGIVDGNQTVHLTASATGIQPASATLVVSDRDLPDLVIRHLTFPTNALTEAPISIAYSLANQGLAPASGAWIQKVYLSTDPILDNQDSLLEQQVCSNTIPVSQKVERTITPRLPLPAGDYWIIAVADANNNLEETIEENNITISATPLHADPAYTVTVETAVSQAAAGTPIALEGRAVRPTGEPAPFVLVYIQVQVNGTVRTLEATTDANGRFNAIFTPSPGEAGRFSIGAMHPGMAAAPVQDEFVLLGMRITPDDAFHEINALETATGTLDLANWSDIPITGLTATIQAASGLSTQVEVAPRIEGSSTIPVRYTVQSLLNESALRSIVIQIGSAEGIIAEAEVILSIRPLRPQIRVFPDSLEGGMLRGQSSIYRMEVANIGGAATGPLRVVLPDLTWMHVVSANPLPSLEPGQTHPIELQLAPGEDLDLGEYTGALAVSGTAAGVSVPYAFRNVSTAIGDLRLTIQDERAYYGQNLTNVDGATIILTDPYTGAVVITGQSDASGQFVVRGLREGAYSLQVSSPKHDMASGSIEIQPGAWTEQCVFLRSQLVRYTWTVEEIEIEDRTRIVLDTTYETAVPVPVVTVEPPFIDLTQVQGNVHQIVLKITNHGLIAAQNMTIDFPDHPRWILTPLITNVGTLPAKSTVEVPLICVRKPAGAMAAQAGGRIQAAGAVSEAASAAGTIGWSVLCGTALIPYNLFMHMVELLDVDVTWVEPPKIQEWTEPRVPRIGRRTLEQLLEDAYYRADIFSTFSQPSLPTLNLGRICQCDPKKFKPACLGGQLGLKFDFESVVNRMVEAATAGWAHVNESHLTLRFQGETCTCCEDYLLGLEGNINAGAEGEISVLIGPRTPDLFTGRVLIPGLGYVRYAAKIEAGVVVGLEARFAGKVDSSCNFGDPEWCVEGYVKGKGGVKAEAKAACILEDPITGKEFGFDANTKIEIMAGGG
ncbi:MAG: hypothetical protein KA118_11480, partial [Verrucomicrobia bacterium]|nr:hypothetical protein [Verrucomicrobiota bacterium]